MKGKIVSELPPRRSRYADEKEQYDWDSAAKKALDHPGQAVLAAENVPLTRIASLRMMRREPFFKDGERQVSIHMRNSTVEYDQSKDRVMRFGDVYLTATED